MRNVWKKKTIFIAIAVIAVILLYWWYSGHGDTADNKNNRKFGADGRPLPVQAAVVKRGDINVTVEALGTVTALNTSVVKARVAGQLTKIAFKEGQLVKAGDLLAEIDPRTFQAQLDQSAGQLARDEALLANAKVDLERYRGLLKKDSIASQQVDNQEWLVRQYEGTVKNDHGLVDSAKLQLSFARVTAPVSGRVGLRQVDVGNYVQTSDTTGIAVVTQTQPLNVVFAIPADQLTAVVSHLHAGDKMVVSAYARGGKTLLSSGRLMSVDNQIDVTTGTVKLKAEFENRDEQLFPNQFVNVRLSVETRHDVVLAPVASIQRGAQGTFVYSVGKEGEISVRAVTLGPVSGDVVVVERGLDADTQVVIDGADKLREGVRVTVATPGAGKDEKSATADQQSTTDDRQKRWADLNARIDRGEFGEEIKKLPEEERKKRMRELRAQRSGNDSKTNAP